MSTPQSSVITRLQELNEQESKLGIERALTLDQALHSKDVDTIFKAQQYYSQFMQRQNGKPKTSATGVKSMILDPLEVSSSMGYFNKATALSYSTLRAMSRAPIIRAIINTRKDQVAEFCKPQSDKYQKGFIIAKKGVTDPEELSKSDQSAIKVFADFIVNCGEPENKWKWDGFETFIRKWVEDSLTLDQGCFEVIPQRDFLPHSFVAVDGATFRIADSYDDDRVGNDDVKINGCYPSYVQVYQGVIIREFYPWELCFGIRNPSTNILKNGYGESELEVLIQTITAMLNSDTYNANFFRQGTAPKGALMVKGANIDPNAVAELRRDWSAMMAGVSNMHKTPVLNSDEVTWLDLQKTNRDMEFSKFQEYLIKVACAIFKISPEEIGFPLEGSKGGGIGGNDSGESEKQYSIDKGLKPLLTFIQNCINKYIVGPKSNDLFEFRFVGIDIESATQEEERLTKAVTTYMTIDEVRAAKNLKPLPGGKGKMILSPIMAQMIQGEQQAKSEQQNSQGEQDREQEQNQNPFLDDEEQDGDPFVKGFDEWFRKQYTTEKLGG